MMPDLMVGSTLGADGCLTESEWSNSKGVIGWCDGAG